jgi:hypothetical protein
MEEHDHSLSDTNWHGLLIMKDTTRPRTPPDETE